MEYFVKGGHNVFLITMPPPKYEPKKLLVNVNINMHHTHQIVTNNSVFDHFILFNMLILFEFLRLNKKVRFHVVHCHGNGALAVALLKKLRLLRMPFIYTVHGGAFGGYRAYLTQCKQPSLLRTILYKIFCRMERFWCHTADHVIVTSKLVENYVEKYYHVKQEKISYIIDAACEPVEKLSINREPFFLCVGRLERTKNFDKVIIAMKDVVQHYPYLRLFIVGDGPEREKLKKLIKDLKLCDNVFFKGFVQQKELDQLYDRALALIHPSILEGVSNVLVEALAHGIFIIASKESGATDVIKDVGTHGYILEKATSNEIAKYIMLFLEKKVRCLDKISEAIYKHSFNYTFKMNSHLHLRLYRSLVLKDKNIEWRNAC
jgi:glycosyltransferase involved in cell wall biosynthesis